MLILLLLKCQAIDLKGQMALNDSSNTGEGRSVCVFAFFMMWRVVASQC